jgi:hypothetical protein
VIRIPRDHRDPVFVESIPSVYSTRSFPLRAHHAAIDMSEKKEDMGAVTHQLSIVDDDMHKPTHTKEANVASVALSKSSTPVTRDVVN